MKNANVIRALIDAPWAIMPDKLRAICGVVANHTAGIAAVSDTLAAARSPVRRRQGAVAVLPVYGTVAQRMNLLMAYSGGTSTEKLSRDFAQALADDSVGSIVLEIDSPGGTVYGVEEIAAEIRAARGRKPIVAMVNSLAASAAYWIASQADEIVVTPSGEVGSIGVYAVHVDESKALEDAGFDVTLVTAGRRKVEGNPYEPLTEEALEGIQGRVNDYYRRFVSGVAAGRDVSASTVRSGFGEGAVVGSDDAVNRGMADRVGTMAETITRLTRPGAEVRTIGRRATATDAAPCASIPAPDPDPEPKPDVEPDTVPDEPQKSQANEQERESRNRRRRRLTAV